AHSVSHSTSTSSSRDRSTSRQNAAFVATRRASSPLARAIGSSACAISERSSEDEAESESARGLAMAGGRPIYRRFGVMSSEIDEDELACAARAHANFRCRSYFSVPSLARFDDWASWYSTLLFSMPVPLKFTTKRLLTKAETSPLLSELSHFSQP